MKTIQITATQSVHVVNQPKPALAPGLVLLKIAHVGLCGSDLNTFRGTNCLAKMPLVPGHEIGATIEAVGQGVPATMQVGDRATVIPYTCCGHCVACINGQPNACACNQTLGVQRDGALAEFLLVPFEKVLVENSLSTQHLALVEPLSVGFHAICRAAVACGDTVVVFGCGMVGLGAVVSAAAQGARVVAVDVDATKLALARKLGATETIDSSGEDFCAQIARITNQRGADVVIEAAGQPETSVAAIEVAAFTGRVVYIGYTQQPVVMPTQLIVKKELHLKGSRNALPNDFKAVIEILKQPTFVADTLVSAVYPPEEAVNAFESWNREPGKVCRILIQF